MRNWILAAVVVAVLGFFAVETPAQETLNTQPGTTVTKGEPLPLQTSRSGLFRRFQERRGVVTVERMPATPTTPANTKVEASPTTPPATVTTPQVVEPRTGGLLARMRSRR